MPPEHGYHHLSALLDDLLSLHEASTVDAVLRAAVVAACHVTGSRRGTAGLCDGPAVVSEASYDVDKGWARARLRWPVDQAGPGRVCISATPLLCNSAPCADGPSEGNDALGRARFACIPLLSGGEALGFVNVGDKPERYTSGDVRTLNDLARHATLRLRQVVAAGRHPRVTPEALADIADRLQRRLLPLAPPELPGFDVAFIYRSASAGVLSGGDFVDCYTRSPNTLAFAIGDVAGKGVDAMAITFVTKFILRGAVHGGQLSWPTNPGEALQELRTGLLEQPDFSGDPGRFVTVLFGLINARHGSLELSSAGHPTPFVVRRRTVERPLLLTEPAIGVELGAALAPYPTETVELRRGDVVVMFTDGVAELRDTEGHFFEDEMATVLQGCHNMPAGEVLEKIMAAAEAFSARPPADDRAMLCIRLTAKRQDV
jgi:serine phosphatase RsbU (regulator of sigma subunit)